jgi:hypothetical protein
MFKFKCGACGKELTGDLDHAAIAEAMGGTIKCGNCIPLRFRHALGATAAAHQSQSTPPSKAQEPAQRPT